MTQAFQQLLNTHCAPALAGRRPACVLVCSRDRLPLLEQDLRECAAFLLARGKRMRVLGQRGRRLALLVYDPVCLEACLIGFRARRLLGSLGYPRGALSEALLDELGRRAGQGRRLPREIRLFLGWPARAVEAALGRGGPPFRHSRPWGGSFLPPSLPISLPQGLSGRRDSLPCYPVSVAQPSRGQGLIPRDMVPCFRASLGTGWVC